MKREKEAEAYLREKIKAMGGLSLKWVSPGNAGVPDRIVIAPGGRVWFVEFKTEEGELTKIQEFWQKRLKRLGCRARVIKGKKGAQEFIEEVKGEIYGA